MEIEAGQVYKIEYPFIKCVYVDCTEEGSTEIDSYRPGVDSCGEDPFTWQVKCVADKPGKMVITVISLHKPGKYPERIFYVRTWEDPFGKPFGKTGLKIATVAKFKRIISGYRDYVWYRETKHN